MFSIIIKDLKESICFINLIDLNQISKEFYKFIDVFLSKNAEKFLLYCLYNYEIRLNKDVDLLFGPLYLILRLELEVLKEWLKDNLYKEFIYFNLLFVVSLILFVKKLKEEFYFYIDYYTLNNLFAKDYYLLLLIKELLNNLKSIKYFIKIDIISVFNNICIKESQKYLIVFYTHFGLYKSLVISFELINVLTIFQCFINDTLYKYLDLFCIAYLNDILIYSKTYKEYFVYIRKILFVLKKAGLFTKLLKYEFLKSETTFFGLIVKEYSICINFKKI